MGITAKVAALMSMPVTMSVALAVTMAVTVTLMVFMSTAGLMLAMPFTLAVAVMASGHPVGSHIQFAGCPQDFRYSRAVNISIQNGYFTSPFS